MVFRGREGTVLWKKTVGADPSSCMLRGEEIMIGDRGLDYRTGEVRWNGYARARGCDVPLASLNMLLFRSAAAGYYDLIGRSGSGNFGGFRSACNASLIAAGGLINAPKSAQGCDCNTPNQTSLALVHDPEVETWTWGGERGKRRGVGINFGAPGDRLSEEGTFWLDYPSVGGRSPDIPVKTEPEAPEWFCRHSSRVRLRQGDRLRRDSARGRGLKWVAASGAIGLRSITLTTTRPEGEKQEWEATVRLHFAEPEEKAPGQRVFSVSLQGNEVIRDLDVVKEAGGRLRPVVREFKRVALADARSVGSTGRPDGAELTVTFTPSRGASVICGIEVLARPSATAE